MFEAKAFIERNGPSVVGKHRQFNAQNVPPLVGIFGQCAHQCAADPLAMGVPCNRYAQTHRMAAPHLWPCTVQAGKAKDLVALQSHELQSMACLRRAQAFGSGLFSGVGQLQHVAKNFGVSCQLGNGGGVMGLDAAQSQ